MAPIAIGAIAGVVCCYAVQVKFKAGYDDALDVVGVHFVGGLVGSLLIGFFANPEFFGGDVQGGPVLRRRRSRCSASSCSPTW